MASRAAMTVYGVAARIVQKLLGLHWIDEALKYRCISITLQPQYYIVKKEATNCMVILHIQYLNCQLLWSFTLRTALHNKYGNRRLRVDDLNSSLTFIKKIAAIGTTTEKKISTIISYDSGF